MAQNYVVCWRGEEKELKDGEIKGATSPGVEVIGLLQEFATPLHPLCCRIALETAVLRRIRRRRRLWPCHDGR